jgi:hypothetical protein
VAGVAAALSCDSGVEENLWWPMIARRWSGGKK